jgi:hypothetical protein
VINPQNGHIRGTSFDALPRVGVLNEASNFEADAANLAIRLRKRSRKRLKAGSIITFKFENVTQSGTILCKIAL